MWSDYNCPKGFHIFDTDTRELERIENPLPIFKKLSYDDTKENYDNLDLSSYENCFVKLFVNRKTNPEMYGNLVERFYNNTNIHELIINEDTNDITQTVRVDTIDFVSISSFGNAIDFGNLSSSRAYSGATSNSVRGLALGGIPMTNSIEYISISTAGNAEDFGDLVVSRYGVQSLSDSHGGLGGF